MTKGGKREGAGRLARPNAHRHNVLIDDSVWEWLSSRGASETIEKLVREAMMAQHTISINNGLSSTTPEAAIEALGMDVITNYLDAEICEKVDRETPASVKTDADWLRWYLQYADIVIG
jgi:hypothetical protein